MSIEKTTKIDGVRLPQNEISQVQQQNSPVVIDLTGNQELSQNQMELLEHFGSNFNSDRAKAIEAAKQKLEAMTPEEREAYIKDLFKKTDMILPKEDTSLYSYWKNQWKEDFRDVDSIGSFLKAVVNRTRSGFKAIDSVTTDVVKYPVKLGAEKIDELLEDNTPESIALKMWEFTKGVGDVADYCTSVEGLWLMAATVAGLEAIGAGAGAVAGIQGEVTAKTAIQYGFRVYGGMKVYSGVKDVFDANTPQDYRVAGEELATGGLFVAGATKMNKPIKALKDKAALLKKASVIKPADAATMPYSKLKANVEEVFNEAFDQMGIPKEARPKLNIIDNIKYKSKAEIEQMVLEKVNSHIGDESARIKELKIFEEADNPMNMTEEQIVAKIKAAVEKTPKAEITDIEYEEIIGNGDKGTGGDYEQRSHEISFNAGNYRNNMYKTIEEVIVHEAEHARNAVLRHRVSSEESKTIVKEALVERILNGEPELIIYYGHST